MVQGGLHQGMAVCEGLPGLPVALPAPRLVLYSSPHSLALALVPHRSILGMGS